ncbi:NUDIX hydrolase [Paenibacillus hexagrammi]|uniref:NUDIX domain-containing protein n=1 Tax=Paenibacillus hexagrammi TaxID=2908839 RepID=A0ABY3SR22_9BACL|nr:NUDIX domain-containing protein [Paenibacillus sp. YPD9-1]UJF35850.1 NUDIX domain-containing protein [Paenibacillus sp. YPD9-1]
MSKEEEWFDIFDENMNRIGAAPRSEVHAKGMWHQTFQCWIVSCEKEAPMILLQLRHPDKDLFPDLLDISCAGHLAAGETIYDGVRELAEELGIEAQFDELLPCGIYAEEDVISEQLADREFCHVFVFKHDRPLKEYMLQPEEVSGLFAVPLQQFRELITHQLDAISAEGVLLTLNGSLQAVQRRIALNDIVPHPQDYYELVFRGIDKLGL